MSHSRPRLGGYKGQVDRRVPKGLGRVPGRFRPFVVSPGLGSTSSSSSSSPSPPPPLLSFFSLHPRRRQAGMSSHNSSNNIVGGHYRVGKKIGEGSFGVIFEGACLPASRRPTACARGATLTVLRVCPRRLEPFELADRRYQIRTPPQPHVLAPIVRCSCLRVIQEPRKAEAPQLRDECRSYRILAGCRQYPPAPSYVRPARLTGSHVAPSAVGSCATCSRDTPDIPLRAGRPAQHPRH